MITIANIGGEPARKLTPQEKQTVTSQLSNGVNFIYYQGDEPVDNSPVFKMAKWSAMNNALLNSGGILTKMRTAAAAAPNMMTFFTLVFAVMQNGANGFAAEADLETLLKLNWGFSTQEKTTINNYFSNNDFSITI